MKKIIVALVFIALGVGFFSLKSQPKYPLAICAIFYNEDDQLEEWIDFHHKAMGVSHFYLYNNNSSDNYREVLTPYIEKGIVDLIEWPSTDEHAIFGIDDTSFVPYQIAAYRDCLKNRAYREAEWVAMIDIDEYIVPACGKESLYTLLNEEKKNKTGSFRIYWKVFGTSGVKSLKSGERLTEKLIRCAPEDYEWNTQIKSFHQPKAAARTCTAHVAFEVKKGYKIKEIKKEVCRIHHYWAGTEEQCKNKRHLDEDNAGDFLRNLNAHEDLSIYPYIFQTRSLSE